MIESLSSLGYFRFKSILSAFIVYDPVRVCSHEDITPKPKQIRRMTAGKNELSAVSPLDQFLVRSFIQNFPDLEKLIISQNFQERLSIIFENPATEAKIQLFFYFLKKTLLVNRFQK